MSDITPHIGEIEQILQKAAIDGTLTSEAIDIFHATLQENEALKDTNRQLKDDNRKLDERTTQMSSEISELSTQVGEWAKREQDLKDREKECTRNELLAEYNQLRVNDHKEMFATVFKGIHMRKQVVTPASTTVDQYGTRQSDMPDTTPVVDEE